MSAPVQTLEPLLTAGVLLMLRLSVALVTMPVFSSPGIPARVKALIVLTLVVVLTPVAAYMPNANLELTLPAMLGEIVVGLTFGLTLSLLQEAVVFCGALLSGAFSFSLANLVDPNSQVETEVAGTVLGWMTILVLLAAGLHRTMLAALLRTVQTVPLGRAPLSAAGGSALLGMASGIFLSGLQLAAPVVAAALLMEVAVGLVSRMAPAMPAQIASVPLKTIVSYLVLVGSLSLWPGWLEGHFRLLLDAAQRGVRP